MFRDNSIETCILSRVKQITSPGWMHAISAQAWCTGKTQRDRVEREVGGDSEWGIHVNPWLIHVNVWQKPLQYCKVISLQLIKITGKKKRKKWGIGKMENYRREVSGKLIQLCSNVDWEKKTHFAVQQHGIILSKGSEWGLGSTLGTPPRAGGNQGSVWLSILAQPSGKRIVPC